MHRQTLALSLGSLLAVLIGTLVAVRETPLASGVREWAAELAPEPEPVLVVVVRDRASVYEVLAAVDSRSVVAASVEGFAVRDRRVVAASLEAVGPLLLHSGWRDEPIEIITAGRGPRAASPAPDRVATLLEKPRLTLLESRALLGHL